MVDMGLKPILLTFVFLIVGLTLIAAVADNVTDATEQKTASNESIDLVINSAVSLSNSQLDALTELRNSTGQVIDTSNYTVNLDAGSVTATDNASFGTLSNAQADYTYRKVGDGNSRALVTLITIFFAIAVFLFMFGLISPNFREMLRF